MVRQLAIAIRRFRGYESKRQLIAISGSSMIVFRTSSHAAILRLEMDMAAAARQTEIQL